MWKNRLLRCIERHFRISTLPLTRSSLKETPSRSAGPRWAPIPVDSETFRRVAGKSLLRGLAYVRFPGGKSPSISSVGTHWPSCSRLQAKARLLRPRSEEHTSELQSH